jgi:hypothetical protein
MSTVAYGALTEARKTTPAGTVNREAGLGTYIDILAALVPAEVIAAHAFILTLATKTVKDAKGHSAVTITQKGALTGTFWALLVLSVLLFFAGRWLKGGGKPFDWRWDILRLLIPPAAFVAWTMIQKNTAFDAISSWHGDQRAIVAVLIAVFLSFLAGALSVQADRQNPLTDGPPPPAFDRGRPAADE